MKLKMYRIINLNNKNKRKKILKVEDIQLLNNQEIDSIKIDSTFKLKKV